jgi:hypothetical protein
MITFGIIFVTFLVNVLILSSITRDIIGSIKNEIIQLKKDKLNSFSDLYTCHPVQETTKINIVNMVISIILILVIGRNHPYGNHQ